MRFNGRSMACTARCVAVRATARPTLLHGAVWHSAGVLKGTQGYGTVLAGVLKGTVWYSRVLSVARYKVRDAAVAQRDSPVRTRYERPRRRWARCGRGHCGSAAHDKRRLADAVQPEDRHEQRAAVLPEVVDVL